MKRKLFEIISQFQAFILLNGKFGEIFQFSASFVYLSYALGLTNFQTVISYTGKPLCIH